MHTYRAPFDIWVKYANDAARAEAAATAIRLTLRPERRD